MAPVLFVVCSYGFRVFGLLSSAAFCSRNAASWHIPFETCGEKVFNSFLLTGIAQEQINYSIPAMEPKTETSTSARMSLETGVIVAAFLLIALILMRPWLPV